MSMKLRKKACDIGVINPRIEKHGEEPVPAMDIPVTLLITQPELNKITSDPHRADKWYDTRDGKLAEPTVPDTKPYKFKNKFEGCSVKFILGVNSKEVDIATAKFTGISFETQAGGMTIMKLKMQTIITNKTNEMFLWMGREGEVELQFGELKENAEQGELDVNVKGDGDDKPLNTHGDGEAATPGKKGGRRKTSDGETLNA